MEVKISNCDGCFHWHEEADEAKRGPTLKKNVKFGTCKLFPQYYSTLFNHICGFHIDRETVEKTEKDKAGKD